MFFIRYPVPEIRDEVPEDFSKPPNFLTAGSSARIETGGSAAAWRSFWRSTNASASFRSTTALSQSLTWRLTPYPCSAVNCPWSPQFCGVLLWSC